MVTWIEQTFGSGAVPWFFFCATIALCVAGVAGTIFCGVSGLSVGFAVSVPAIIVGVLGCVVTGLILDDHNYI